MQAVILAAGEGRRLRPVTDNVPKGLLDIGGHPLLRYSLDSLEKHGIRRVVIVVGYLHQSIRQTFGQKFGAIQINYVMNDVFNRSGSMYSLSQAQQMIEEDIILLESDLIYEPRAIELIINSPYQNCILVAPARGTGDEVYICVDKQMRITDLGKYIHSSRREKSLGELVGISRFSHSFLDMLFIKAEKDYQNGKVDLHYEESVFSVRTLQNPVYALFCKDLIWTEIDTVADLSKARESIFPGIKSVSGKTSTRREQDNGY